MLIGIVCKVIDNFGDAGFSLRLGRAMARHGHHVMLIHDHAPTFEALYPTREIKELELIDATEPNFTPVNLPYLDLILEPFGTSSEQTNHRFDRVLKERFPLIPWLLIDYLSSEDWVEKFHLSSSKDPRNGHLTTYFYPGFTEKTGGLIHCDYSIDHQTLQAPRVENPSLFVFAYPNAPLNELLNAVKPYKSKIGIAGGLVTNNLQPNIVHLPFCPQSEFDSMLAKYDVLFVRGEDSFVRAQLAGKPFIWQIYATPDDAHADKLISFYRRYANGLSHDCAEALWACWTSWNRLENCPDFSASWSRLQIHWPELHAHAARWQQQLLSGPELVKEVLTWRHGQTPTFIEKPDL